MSFAKNAKRHGSKSPEKKPSVLPQRYVPLESKLRHVSVNAGAGTGKTTTAEMAYRVAIKGESPKFEPSEEQAAVIDAFKGHRKDASVAFMCFNVSIRDEFVARGLPGSTNHQHGFAACRTAFSPRVDRADYKTWDILTRDLPSHLVLDGEKKDKDLAWQCKRLVSLCKNTLTGWRPGMTEPSELCDYPEWESDLDAMLEHYGLNFDRDEARVKALLPSALRLSASQTDRISFDDMVWLPVVRNCRLDRHELLIVDERQDLNRCQLELVTRSADRICGIGDPLQAIYGFAGADAEAFENMNRWMDSNGGRVTLPLMETRRCPVTITKLANQDAPNLRPHKDNTLGRIVYDLPWDGLVGDCGWEPSRYDGASFRTEWCPPPSSARSFPPRKYMAGPGDLLLCRLNAPLIQLAYRFLRRNIPAVMLGKDVMDGIQSMLRKSKAGTMPELLHWTETFRAKEIERLSKAKNPSQARMAAVHERCDCLVYLSEGCDNLNDFTNRLNTLFDERKDRSKCVTLSSIHRAKGLEAYRVFLICPEKLPLTHPKMQEWEHGQERNLRYVARTRVKGSKKDKQEGELIFVTTPDSAREREED